MSSDPFSDFANSLEKFSSSLEGCLQQSWPERSQAWVEADDQSLAGAWGSRPSRDALLAIYLLVASTFDHLRALSVLIVSPRVVYGLSSAARGALEAGAQAHYLGDPAIDMRERVRRYNNGRLLSLHESCRLVAGFSGDDPAASSEVDRLTARSNEIFSCARSHGYGLSVPDSGFSSILLSVPDSGGRGEPSCTQQNQVPIRPDLRRTPSTRAVHFSQEG
jgi:hypothetical protein